ncbi:helix-turn-helix domain-containing protein [Chelativorans sp.]|uniref:helix-turn-helix domain-containing protein n=1 Tax=Chelativorans sp. TaxID=2203393 RepID=UPI002810CC94|nr:helix-turn-helix domain-containing protein [Chelativorans sp.]
MTFHTPRHCPCCGQPINAGRAPIEALDAAPLATVPRTIVNALAEAYPRSVPAEFLIERIYSGSHEPENARTALNVQLSRLRDKLALYGWTIPRGPTGRGNRASYKLEPLQ